MQPEDIVRIRDEQQHVRDQQKIEHEQKQLLNELKQTIKQRSAFATARFNNVLKQAVDIVRNS